MIVGIVIGLTIGGLYRNDVYLFMYSKWKGEEIMYALGCIIAYVGIAVFIVALLS